MKGIISKAPKFNSVKGGMISWDIYHANFFLLDIPHIIVGHFLCVKDCKGATEKNPRVDVQVCVDIHIWNC